MTFFFQTTPSSLKPSPIFWYAVINGKRETIAFIANGMVTVFKQCLNKCKIMEPATLTIGNLTDNDFTTYDIQITTPGIVERLTSNTTVVKAGSKILHLVLFFLITSLRPHYIYNKLNRLERKYYIQHKKKEY